MFAAIEPYVAAIKIGLAIAFCAALFFAGWHARGTHDIAATVAAQAKAIDTGNKLNAADNKAAVQHEAERVRIEYRDRIVATQAAVDVAKTPSYNTCQLKPADLDLLNQAIDGGAP